MLQEAGRPAPPEAGPAAVGDGRVATEDTPLATNRDVPLPVEVRANDSPLAIGEVPIRSDGPDAPSGVGGDGAGSEVTDVAASDLPMPSDGVRLRDIPGDPIKPPVDVLYSIDSAELAELCTRTGGQPTMVWCGPVAEFLDTCSSGLPCYMCRPFCRDVATCACPNEGCFKPPYGCLGKRSNCTVGMDQTCNDNPALSVTRGQCIEGGYCLCPGSVSNPTTGKCL